MRIDLSIEVPGAPEGLSRTLEAVGAACCRIEGIEGMEASMRLIDGEEIRRINRTFRGIDRETDVLSFPSISYKKGQTARNCEKKLRRERDIETGLTHLGDFVISLPRAKEQAESYGHSLLREIAYLTAHSIFHLCGYDHEDEGEKRAMRALEERAMAECGLSREEDLQMGDQALFDMACEALKTAYAPYSNFRVGACLLSEDGRAFTGCNVENASFGATICAERTALVKAISEGARRFTAIAVVGEESDAWPCGVCRQVLCEFSEDMRVICGNARARRYTEMKLSELLPKRFGPEEIK